MKKLGSWRWLAGLAAIAVSCSSIAARIPQRVVVSGAEGAPTRACIAQSILQTECRTLVAASDNSDLTQLIQVNVGFAKASATWIEERQSIYKLCAMAGDNSVHCVKLAMPRLNVVTLVPKNLDNGTQAITLKYDTTKSPLTSVQKGALTDAFLNSIQRALPPLRNELATVGIPTSIRPLRDGAARTMTISTNDDCAPGDDYGISIPTEGSPAKPQGCGDGDGGGDVGGGGDGGGDGGGGDGPVAVTDPACADACYSSYEETGQNLCNSLAIPAHRAVCWAGMATILAACLLGC